MAVYFIMNGPGGTIDGYMLHRADTRDLQVGIIHDPKDGYKLGFDGQIIKETLGLGEFIERLSIDGHGTGGYNLVPHEKMEYEIRQVLVILLSHKELKIAHLAETLDRRYSDLIMRGKLMLAEHTISMKLKTDWDRDKVMKEMDRQGLKVKQYPMTPDEAFRVSDDEVYYSMTL